MADRDYTPDEMRLVELYHQLIALSDDKTVAGRFIFLGADGAVVAHGSLAARDIEAVTDALISVNIQRADMEEATRPADPLPVLDADDAAEFFGEIEAFLANGGEA
jgi:hypothetical protein